MTTITANSTVGIVLSSPTYTAPVTVDPGITLSSHGNAVFAASGFWELQNQGLIAGTGTTLSNGIVLSAGGYVDNLATGRISGALAAIDIAGAPGTVVNAGTVTNKGSNRSAIVLMSGGTIVNSGQILGTGFGGIYAQGAPATVINSGLITGASIGGGIAFLAGGYVSNAASGTILAGQYWGVFVLGAAGTVVNAGSIIGGAIRPGIYLDAGGKVTNASGGFIAGGSSHNVVYVYGATGTVINAGTIVSTAASAINLVNGGYVGNEAGGTIVGTAGNAIYMRAGVGTVTNFGTLIANAGTTRAGVSLPKGGAVHNGNGGLISAVAATDDGIILRGAGGYIGNAPSGIITGAAYGILASSAAATVVNAGTIGGAEAIRLPAGFDNRVIIDAGATFIGTVDGGNTIGATVVSVLELASTTSTGTLAGLGSQFIDFAQTTIDTHASWALTGANTVAGTLVNDGAIVLDPSALSVNRLTGDGSVTIDASVLNALGTVGGHQTISFYGGGGYLHLFQPTNATGGVVNFGAGDTIDLKGITSTSVSYNTGTLSFDGGAFPLDIVAGNTLQIAPSADGTALTALCFVVGTMILTPNGERPVQELEVGDLVTTAHGEARPITWIGAGKVLATRGRRNAATPVIVRKNAIAPGIPSRDLHVTKGHCLYIDDVLIPVEFLVNHRSIMWDDRAQEVELYHVELDTHDVLIADGVPAESYRDDGNRWLFRNASSGWKLLAQQPCVPILTGGPIVDAVWRRLLDRSGPRPGLPLTDDADLHLVVDGERVDAVSRDRDVVLFRLSQRPESVRIVSRSAAPDQLGIARDPRELGVALRQIVLTSGRKRALIEADDTLLVDGFHRFEVRNAVRWTNGDAALPAEHLDGFDGPVQIELTVAHTVQYLADEEAA